VVTIADGEGAFVATAREMTAQPEIAEITERLERIERAVTSLTPGDQKTA
jgi:hypothetical protein